MYELTYTSTTPVLNKSLSKNTTKAKSDGQSHVQHMNVRITLLNSNGAYTTLYVAPFMYTTPHKTNSQIGSGTIYKEKNCGVRLNQMEKRLQVNI